MIISLFGSTKYRNQNKNLKIPISKFSKKQNYSLIIIKKDKIPSCQEYIKICNNGFVYSFHVIRCRRSSTGDKMSVWTTTNTGLETVLATTLGAASTVLTSQAAANPPLSRPRTPISISQLHKSVSQQNLPKTNNIQQLTLNLREDSCCHRSIGSGSSPIIHHNCGHSQHQINHNHHHHHHNPNHNSINQFHPAPPSQYASSQHLFTANSNVSFGWTKSGAIYQQKVSCWFYYANII